MSAAADADGLADRLVDQLLARCTFPSSGTAVSLAVSGGADSSALLVLACRAGLAVTAIHVDHGLRDGSALEADGVRRLAGRFGATFRAETAVVEAGPNLEERARTARYAALPDGVLTGHTMDDQAETVLINLLRGAGPHGLGAMDPRFRPLLGLRRAETRALCEALDVDVFEDPTNDSPAHLRNRIRHEVLPLLCEVAGRDVVVTLARAGTHQREIASLLDALASDVDPASGRELAAAPGPVAAAALRTWLAAEGGLEHPPDSASVERVLEVAAGRRKATEIAGGARVARTGGRLRVEPD